MSQPGFRAFTASPTWRCSVGTIVAIEGPPTHRLPRAQGQLRQLRLAEMVAAALRDRILDGTLAPGDRLSRQEDLLAEFQVSPPSVREAMRILETEGLITVQRGSIGGALVRPPSTTRVARNAAMVLQAGRVSTRDVGVAVAETLPICASLCAGRADREVTVVRHLREFVARQAEAAELDDAVLFHAYAREFRTILAKECGNTSLAVLVVALTTLWDRHDRERSSPDAAPSGSRSVRVTAPSREALRDHEEIVEAIAEGNGDRARRLVRRDLERDHSQLLSIRDERLVDASVIR